MMFLFSGYVHLPEHKLTRVPSQNSAGLFPSLMNQKQSEGAAARRQSLHDQRPATGIFGQMWHKYASRLVTDA